MKGLAKQLITNLFKVFCVIIATYILISLVNFPGTKNSEDLASAISDNSLSALVTNSEIYKNDSLDIDATSVLASDLKTGNHIFRFNSEKKWPLASTTKLMTALIVSDLMKPNDLVTVTKEAILTEGASGNYSVQEVSTVSDLIKSMLLVSSNDAAEALSINYGKDRFVKIMNSKAIDLGMTNTEFYDSSGVSAKNLGTAEDLEKLAKFIWYNRRDVLDITRYIKGTVINKNTGESRELTNINLFAGRPEFLGGKTGTLPEIGGNLISFFDINGPKLIIIMGAQDKFKETEKAIQNIWFKKQ